MKSFIWKPFILCGAVMLFLGLLAGCGSGNAESESTSGSDSSEKIKVVAAEDFYGEVAEAVGGDQVEVTSIINKPNMEPHEFEPTPANAKTVESADVVIYNGLGYDPWMDDLADSGNDKAVLRVSEDVMDKKDGDNEHQWYNPETMPKLADEVADQLAKIDPDHEKDFKQNAEDYKASIAPVKDLVDELSQSSDHQRVDVSEPVFDYMIEALGYETGNDHFKQAVEEGTDPSPKDIAQMQEDIEQKKIAFFVNNVQESSPTVEKMVSLAEENDVPVIDVTETLPEGKDYKTWMLDILNQVKEAQK